MHNADAGRHNLEGVECLHSPFEEFIPLTVALEFQIQVLFIRVLVPGEVHLHGVIDDQIDGHEGFDHPRIFAHAGDGRAHGGQIHQQGNPCEILQNNSRHDKRNLMDTGLGGFPLRQIAHVLRGDFQAIAISQHRLEHDADGHWKP